jgi:hypothetical protein
MRLITRLSTKLLAYLYIYQQLTRPLADLLFLRSRQARRPPPQPPSPLRARNRRARRARNTKNINPRRRRYNSILPGDLYNIKEARLVFHKTGFLPAAPALSSRRAHRNTGNEFTTCRRYTLYIHCHYFQARDTITAGLQNPPRPVQPLQVKQGFYEARYCCDTCQYI